MFDLLAGALGNSEVHQNLNCDECLLCYSRMISQKNFGCRITRRSSLALKIKLLPPSKHLSMISLIADIGDRGIEVIGLENVLYVGQIIAGVRQHGLRLAQCSSLTIK